MPRPEDARPARDYPSGGAGARLAGAQQPLTELAGQLGRRVELSPGRKGLQRLQAEQPQEEVGRAVEHGSKLGSAGLLDDAPLQKRGHGGFGTDAADARDLRAGD